MKPMWAAIVCILTGACGARADVKVLKQVEIDGQASSNAIWIQGEKIRTDIPNTSVGPISIIVDHATGDALFLLERQKVAGQMSGVNKERITNGYAEKAPGAAARNEPITLVDTGQTEKVGNFVTRIYTWKKTGFSQKLWVAQDPAALPKDQKQLTMLNEGYGPTNGKAQLQALSGLIVKAETEAEGFKRTETVVAVAEDNLDPTLFQKPADYQLKPMPGPAGK